MLNDESFKIALIATTVVAILLGALALRRLKTKREGASALKVKVEDYYDEEYLGVIEVASGQKHVFPIYLVQKLDLKAEKKLSEIQIAVYVTAEFNYAEFHFSEQEAEAFLGTMERALPDFQAASARQKLREALEQGSVTTIYVSPAYAELLGQDE